MDDALRAVSYTHLDVYKRQVYMLGFSIFTWLNFGWEQGLIFLIATLIMIFQFRKDIVDFFTGHGKRVDVLVTIKKKLGI